MKNLNSEINMLSREILKDKNMANHIEKCLGVISNDGLYAYYVYCKSKKIIDPFVSIFKKIMEQILKNKNIDLEKLIENLCEDLKKMLFVKDIIEKTLIYARYHAKALKG